MPEKLNVVFAGTPDFAAQNLQALLESEFNVIAVYTQPDRRSGRGKKITFSPVKQLAIANDLPIYQPENFKSAEDVAALESLNADIMVVVAYGILLPQTVLDTPRHGCINVHASLLPKWRGAAPIERALMSGDKQTGVTIMQMDKGLDTGDMLAKAYCDISDTMTSADLYTALVPLGSNALIATLTDFSNAKIVAEKQDDNLACYAKKLFKKEADINWSLPADEVSRHIRGLSPRPVAFSSLNGQIIRVWHAVVATNQDHSEIAHSCAVSGTILAADKSGIQVACANNTSVLITQVQLPGGKQLKVSDIINSRKDFFSIGTIFKQTEEL
ncbi:methionyl-tRNA formyltransferase [Gammaproteobacteria bacterium AS21]